MSTGLDNGGAIKLTPDVELIAEQQKEYKMIGRIPVRPGHTLFSVDPRTMEVKAVKITKQVAFNIKTQSAQKSQRVDYDPNLYYCSALNKKNAVKHYKRAIHKYIMDQTIKQNGK